MKPPFRIPGPLGQYLIFTKLNKGGMADVYLAQHRDHPERWVAFKVLLDSLTSKRKFVSMFQSEGELGKRFNHPNIVPTFDVGHLEVEGQDLHFLAMDYVHGRDLGAVGRHFREGDGAMPVPQALYIAREVLRGLAYAHDLTDEAGMPMHLVNRDVSPANVMVSFDGEVRLIDFGIAQATLDFRSQIGAIRGKISYMSPEQVRGLPVDRRSDLFSLSVVLYQLLTGTEPFSGEGEFEQMEKVRAFDPPRPGELNRQVGPEVDALLMRGLTKDPSERYADADEMLVAVEEALVALDSGYDQERLSGFMKRAFKADMELLEARVRKARALLERMDAEEPSEPPSTREIFEVEVELDTPHGLSEDTGEPSPSVALDEPERIPVTVTGQSAPPPVVPEPVDSLPFELAPPAPTLADPERPLVPLPPELQTNPDDTSSTKWIVAVVVGVLVVALGSVIALKLIL